MSIGNIGSYSSVDPFILVEDSSAPGNNNTNGKTLYSGSLSDALILLTAGQSNVANSFPTIYTPTNSNILNFNIYDGATYQAVDPLLGCSTVIPAGNFGGMLADKMINAGITTKPIVIVPVAIDGTMISQWTSDTNLGNRITVALRRLAARGLTPNAILWGQGEGDPATTQVDYQNALSTIISNSRVNGFAGPWFIARETWLAGFVNPDVQAAQEAIVNHGLNIWAGPNSDSLDNTYRQGGGTHFTDAGGDVYAGLWQTALHAYGAPF